MRKAHIYESHLGGGFFVSEEPLDYEDLYCDECGDSDTELGSFDSFKELYYYLVNHPLYFYKDNYDPIKHTEWGISEYGLADLINTMIAFWDYPIESIKVNEYDKSCEATYQELINKMYDIVMYEDKIYCYELDCDDGDIYYVRVDLLDNILDLYPEERKVDFTYRLLRKDELKEDSVMDHVPVCFWDEYEVWESRRKDDK